MMRLFLRCTQLLLAITGAVLLALYGYVWLDREQFQARQTRAFEQQAATAPAPDAAPSQRKPARTYARGDIVGRIQIPRIGVRAVMLEGTDERTLRRAVGHIEGTAIPGQPGNAAVSAHRDTFFRGLGKLRKDDRIRITTLDGDYTYIVESIRIVEPVDTWVLAATADPVLTLITCYPFHYVGRAPKRYVVQARQAPVPKLVEVPRPAREPQELAVSRPLAGCLTMTRDGDCR